MLNEIGITKKEHQIMILTSLKHMNNDNDNAYNAPSFAYNSSPTTYNTPIPYAYNAPTPYTNQNPSSLRIKIHNKYDKHKNNDHLINHHQQQQTLQI